MSIFDNDIERLNFEDFIWIVFIVLIVLDIVGDNYLKRFIMINKKEDEYKANNIFLFVLIITFFIYLYFFVRNINAYEKASDEDKELFLIKILGSGLLLSGVICLICFQYKVSDFIGAPA